MPFNGQIVNRNVCVCQDLMVLCKNDGNYKTEFAFTLRLAC